jgi:hypothetical protein
MKGVWVTAERVEEVRAAARGWKKAGAIGEGTFEEISRCYPEPRTLPAPIWRVLTFVLGSFVLLAVFGAFVVSTRLNASGAWVLCAVFGAAFIASAELQARSPAMALRGGVEAASFWGLVVLVGGLFLLLEESLHVREPAGPNLVLLGAALLFAAAVWRWGSPAFALFAAGAAFILLARAPHGRLLWIAAGVALSAAAERFLDRPSCAPSHRAAAAVLVVCAIAAVYSAVNLWSLDRHSVESLRGYVGSLPEPSGAERVAAILATALVSIAVLARGLARRRMLLLDTGLVLVALSLVTLHAYLHIADYGVVFVVAGSLLVGASLAVNRWLRRGPGGERNGFTADPLFADSGRLGALELVPVLGAHSPAARPPDEPGFSGGGGGFGGGGAGSSW